jgi:hypothetical protein
MMVTYMTATLRKILSVAASVCVAALLSASALAASSSSDDAPLPDVRLDGYGTGVAINEGGTGGTIGFFLVLAGITGGIMFMNAKRSHLD